MCPHPPASFRIRVECHFLPLFPRLPSLSEPSQTLPAISTQLYSAGCESSSHLATQTDTFNNKTIPSESGSAWSSFSGALGSGMWAILSPLRSIIHEQGAWRAQLRVQYVQTICLMTQPSAWSNCILQHLVVPFFRGGGTGKPFCLVLCALWWMAGQWLLCLRTVTISHLDGCLCRLGLYWTGGWVQCSRLHVSLLLLQQYDVDVEHEFL